MDRFHKLFGDERFDMPPRCSSTIRQQMMAHAQRPYQSLIAHPWEDWAETAHYLHINDA
jgi:hypothetical protein